MKLKMTMATLVLGALPLFPAVAAAQQTEQASPQDHSKAGMMKSNSQMMMMMHQELTKLVDQVKESLHGLQKENDIAVIRQKLAEDQALLEQLQSKMKQHQSMMPGMSGSMMTDHMKEMKSAKQE